MWPTPVSDGGRLTERDAPCAYTSTVPSRKNVGARTRKRKIRGRSALQSVDEDRAQTSGEHLRVGWPLRIDHALLFGGTDVQLMWVRYQKGNRSAKVCVYRLQ